MTVLAAIQAACKQPSMGIYPAPTAVFASANQQEAELGALANECAQIIAKSHDWRKLTTLKTQAGDGTTTAFSMPADYDRMPVKAAIYRTAAQIPMSPVGDIDTWMDLQLRSWVGSVGWWIILGGELNVQPALGASDSAKFYYQSNAIVHPVSGANKATFTLDTDTFLLSERLLTLCLIWKWRSQKGLDYQQEIQDFGMAIAQEQARDKGSRIIHVGRARIPDGVSYAFPGTITP